MTLTNFKNFQVRLTLVYTYLFKKTKKNEKICTVQHNTAPYTKLLVIVLTCHPQYYIFIRIVRPQLFFDIGRFNSFLWQVYGEIEFELCQNNLYSSLKQFSKAFSRCQELTVPIGILCCHHIAKGEEELVSKMQIGPFAIIQW